MQPAKVSAPVVESIEYVEMLFEAGWSPYDT
jgi:hypothetical protein